MIISPFALWFIIGSVVAIYSLIDDLFISKNKDVLLYVIHKTCPPDRAPLDKTLLRCGMSMLFIIDILLGPASVFFYYRKTRNMKRLRAKMQNT